MKIGDLVKYSDKSGYVTPLEQDLRNQLGIVLGFRNHTFLIQWSNGTRLWRHIEVLEVVNESR